MTRWVSFALATALLLCAGGCGNGGAEPRLAPRHRFVDLLPTLLELAGVSNPDRAERLRVLGYLE